MMPEISRAAAMASKPRKGVTNCTISHTAASSASRSPV